MKVVYSPKGKLSKFFFHKVYEEIHITAQSPQIFFSETLLITGNTVQIQGHGTFKYGKFATSPEAQFVETTLLKGPLIKSVKVAALIDQNIEVGENVNFLGSEIPLEVITVETHEVEGDNTLKVVGIDYSALEDMQFSLSDREINPKPVIKQGNQYMTTMEDLNEEVVPLLVEVTRPEIKIEIYRNEDENSDEFGECIYKSVAYSFEEPTFWEGSINFLFLDSPADKDKLYKYTIIAKCNNANNDAPIIINYAAVTVSQIT